MTRSMSRLTIVEVAHAEKSSESKEINKSHLVILDTFCISLDDWGVLRLYPLVNEVVLQYDVLSAILG